MVIRVQNEHTYSVADGGQKICRVFSETAAFESDGLKYERKSQLQISMYISQAVIAGIEYRARTNRYVKAEH